MYEKSSTGNKGMTTEDRKKIQEYYDNLKKSNNEFQQNPHKSIEINNETCYNLRTGENRIYNKKGLDKMSLILFLKSNNNLVAVSDSKGSYIIDNQLVEDKIRGPVQKIFKSHKFIMSVHGRNDIITTDNKIMPIETLINEQLNNYNGSHRDFIKKLIPLLQNSFNNNIQLAYTFTFAFIDQYNEIGIEECIINKIEYNFINTTYMDNIYMYGEFSKLPREVTINPNDTLNDITEKGIALMKSAITLGDLFMPYNPVGGDIQIETLNV